MLTLTQENSSTGKRLLAVLLGPIGGLLYIIALPVISIAAVVAIVGGKSLSGITSLVTNLVSFGWRPAEAHLTGKKKTKKNK